MIFRIALESQCISRFKEDGVLPAGYMNKKVYNVGGENLPPPRPYPQQTTNTDQDQTSPISNKRKRDSEDARCLFIIVLVARNCHSSPMCPASQ
jgi:hypothetical protein